jgi:hypothetical protein
VGSYRIVCTKIFFHAVSNMTVDIYLMNAGWWDSGGRTPLQIYLIILLVYALFALAAELTSRTILRKRESGRRHHKQR